MTDVLYAFEDIEDMTQFADMMGLFGAVAPVSPSKSVNDTECLGIDLYAAYGFFVPAFSAVTANTGVCFDLGQGATLWPRSKSNFLIGAGVVDPSYTGPIRVLVVNFSPETLVFNRGDALCQMVGVREDWGELTLVDRIEKETARGRTGGITGRSADA
jgi:dUTP pyrophosphatase